jgi:hypothetical protein
VAFYHDWLDEQLDCTKANQFRYVHSTIAFFIRGRWDADRQQLIAIPANAMDICL